MPHEKIDVVVHRQSIIHSMIEYNDGAVIAQLGPTDMRQAIQYAFGHPKRLSSVVGRLNFPKIRQLTFDEPDLKNSRVLSTPRMRLQQAGPCR